MHPAQITSSDEQDPFAGVPLASDTSTVLELAANRVAGRPLETFDLLLSMLAVDARGAWEPVQLRTTFVSPSERRLYADGDAADSDPSHLRWRTTPLTPTTATAFGRAAQIARDYDLTPLPAAVLALGLVWDPCNGAARALLAESDLDHAGLLELLEDELLDTHLVGLTSELAPQADPSDPDAAPVPESRAPEIEPGRSTAAWRTPEWCRAPRSQTTRGS